jgi:aldose 1-epimerase
VADVVLGHDETPEGLEAYRSGKPNFGTIVGRVVWRKRLPSVSPPFPDWRDCALVQANRIRNGRFEIDGKAYQLPLNNGAHHLHGGPKGFYSKVCRFTLLPLCVCCLLTGCFVTI